MRAIIKIRYLHETWEKLRASIDGQAMSPEDPLCSTFAITTGSKAMEAKFNKGLGVLVEPMP